MKNALLILVVLCTVMGLSWLITCGVVGLICMCFGLEYTWPVATGIWLVLTLLSSFFKSGSKK